MERRQFIKASGTLAATGAMGLSGCMGILGGGGYGDVSQWLPDPTLLDSDMDHYTVFATTPSDLAEQSDSLSSDTWDQYRSNWVEFQYANLLPDEVDRVTAALTSAGSFAVVEGDFDAGTIGDNLLDDGYSRARGVGDYETYATSDDAEAWGLTDSAIISASSSGDSGGRAMDWLGFIVDASNGDVDRYADANADFETLSGEMNVGHTSTARTMERVGETNAESGQFQDQVAHGQWAEVNGEETDITEKRVFVSEGVVLERDFQTYTNDSPRFENYREVDYNINGNVVTVTGTLLTRDYQLGSTSSN